MKTSTFDRQEKKHNSTGKWIHPWQGEGAWDIRHRGPQPFVWSYLNWCKNTLYMKKNIFLFDHARCENSKIYFLSFHVFKIHINCFALVWFIYQIQNQVWKSSFESNDMLNYRKLHEEKRIVKNYIDIHVILKNSQPY